MVATDKNKVWHSISEYRHTHTYNTNKNCIKNIIESRGVSYLAHFTPIENIESILYSGVLDCKWMDSHGIPHSICDPQRLDNKRNASCLSIALPNYQFFYLMRRFRYPNRTWCVVLFDPRILWELDVAFYYTNAANRCVRDRPVDEFKTPQALAKMFDSSVYDRYELERNYHLPSYCTTDPQAEVLVFNRIDTFYIKYLIFEQGTYFNPQDILNIPCYYENPNSINSFFGKRCDYSFWQNHKERV